MFLNTLIKPNLERMNLDIGIKIDESLIIHVDFIELTHVKNQLLSQLNVGFAWMVKLNN